MNQTIHRARQLIDLYNTHRDQVTRSVWIDHALDLAAQLTSGQLRPDARNHDSIYRVLIALQGQVDHLPTDETLAAIAAGHVGEVAVYCDRCGHTHRADYTGATYEIRLAAARAHLADSGWDITAGADLCPGCGEQR